MSLRGVQQCSNLFIYNQPRLLLPTRRHSNDKFSYFAGLINYTYITFNSQVQNAFIILRFEFFILYLILYR